MKQTKVNIMKIKEFVIENDWAGITWVEEVITIAEDGTETIIEVPVHCESFSGHPEHIVMIVDRAEKFGTPLDEYRDLIEQLASTYVAPTQAELDEANRVQKLSEARAYLSSTDYKMTVDYFATLTVDEQNTLTTLRDEARTFIRDNK